MSLLINVGLCGSSKPPCKERWTARAWSTAPLYPREQEWVSIAPGREYWEQSGREIGDTERAEKEREDLSMAVPS